MARPNSTQMAPGGGGGGASRVKVSSNVTVKAKAPAKTLSPKEVARLKAINAPKADPNKSRAKAATKAANKDVVKKPMPKTSKAFGMKITGAPKQVSKTKAAKMKEKSAPKPKSLDQMMAEFRNK
jgi:hypothetical protein